MEWQHHIASVIQQEEKEFSQKHLISQNIANKKLKIENPHPGVSVFNFHYAYPPIPVAQNFISTKRLETMKPVLKVQQTALTGKRHGHFC
jgi:hypothetical protein